MIDYYDIDNWCEQPRKFFNHIQNVANSQYKIVRVSPLSLDICNVYALLKLKISDQPNGFFTSLQTGFPSNNFIWWDYVLESDKGFICVMRTSYILEAFYYFNDEQFDLNKFFSQNISANIHNIQATISKFDKHILYINHYKSYKDCTEYLWNDITQINLTIPDSPKTHIEDRSSIDSYYESVKTFANNSIKFHTLGKSLVLNAAFEIESFLNLVIRIGATPELKNYPNILRMHLNSNFLDKLKNLKFYSTILSKNIDLEDLSVKNALELMTLRNKYVHSDESSHHNRIEEIYFDNNFSLQQVSSESPATLSIIQAFHNPSYAIVEKSYYTRIRFVDYLKSLFLTEYLGIFMELIDQSPIAYNTKMKMYSIIRDSQFPEFYFPTSNNNHDNK